MRTAFYASVLLLVVLLCGMAVGGEPAADGWRMLDPATASATFGRDHSGRLAIGHGIGPVRLEAFAEYERFDHTTAGITFEGFADWTWRNEGLWTLFIAPRLTAALDGDDRLGGETAIRLGFTRPHAVGDDWGWTAFELSKETNGSWWFGHRALGWVGLADWASLGCRFEILKGEHTKARWLIGPRLRLRTVFGGSVTIGADWLFESPGTPDLGVLHWFISLEWRWNGSLP